LTATGCGIPPVVCCNAAGLVLDEAAAQAGSCPVVSGTLQHTVLYQNVEARERHSQQLRMTA
jgi:hypothetical protein